MIPINKPSLSREEVEEVVKVLKSGILTSQSMQGGPKVQEFESALARYVGTRYAVAVNSGTAALYCALAAQNVAPGDEVLVPSFSFAATANVILSLGARPVFVDIRREDYTMEPSDLAKRITSKSRVILPVHLYGLPADMKPIREIAEKKGLGIIEDAAQSLGATYEGRQTGSLGSMGCFSFWAAKVVTCGEGGAVTTDDPELDRRLRMIRNHGMIQGYDTSTLGFNFRMTEISAAIAAVQLKKLDTFLEARRRNASSLLKMLSDIDGLTPPMEDAVRRSNWYLFTIAVKEGRDTILMKLHEEGVDARVYYETPIHKLPLYRSLGYDQVPLKETEWAAAHVLSLPVHPAVSTEDLKRISSILHELLGERGRGF